MIIKCQKYDLDSKTRDQIIQDAKDVGIEPGNLYVDNNIVTLQTLHICGLKSIEGRNGNDASDKYGNEFELKSINIDNSLALFTTNHHLNEKILDKYEKAHWLFSFQRLGKVEQIYYMHPSILKEKYFNSWRCKLIVNRYNVDPNYGDAKVHINNPKIYGPFVKKNGKLIFDFNK